MRELAGKTAVVTGAGNGIGRSIAHALAQAEVQVVVADFLEQDAQTVRDEILAMGCRAIAVRADVAQREQVQHLADTAYAAFGSVEILCNNAGVATRPTRAIWDTSHADFEWMIGVNIWGLVHGIEAFLPRMRAQQGEKHIVNTSSMGALVKAPGLAGYLMTKFAVDGLSEMMREELIHDRIGVTILYPGLVSTGAVERSAQLRSVEETEYDRQVRPYSSYIEEHGESDALIAGSRGRVRLIGGQSIGQPVDPENVGPMVVAAIRANRCYCLTHPSPVEGIQTRADQLKKAYHPVEGVRETIA